MGLRPPTVMSKRFLRSMAQPFEHDQTGVSLWSLEHIEARQQAVREAAEGGRTLPGADETRDPVAQAEAEEWYEGFSDADIMAVEDGDGPPPSKRSKTSAMAMATAPDSRGITEEDEEALAAAAAFAADEE